MREIEEHSEKILDLIRERPVYFYDVLVEFKDYEYRDMLLAWGKLRANRKLAREEETGRYIPAK